MIPPYSEEYDSVLFPSREFGDGSEMSMAIAMTAKKILIPVHM